MLISLYRFVTTCLQPWLERRWLPSRVRQGKEDPARWQEKCGVTSLVRPVGSLIWCHGASVGESLALLPLAEALVNKYPGITVLLTTCTRTSAELLSKRLPTHVIHQYAPLDCPDLINRFLDHWQPCLSVFIESEIWPNTLQLLQKRNIPKFLVSGRVSPRSARHWQWVQKTFQQVCSYFDGIFVQSTEQASCFNKLGVMTPKSLGNLKFAAKPLAYKEETLRQMQRQIGPRPLWLAASTHPGEEELIGQAHQELRKIYPDLLTIIALRHPKRANEVIEKLSPSIGREHIAVRSAENSISNTTRIYIVDTLGEMGLFFKLCEIVFLGGSLVPVGGHNLLEPAHYGCATLHGPYMDKTKDLKALFHKSRAIREVQTVEDIIRTVHLWLDYPERAREVGQAAQGVAIGESRVLETILSELDPYLTSSCSDLTHDQNP